MATKTMHLSRHFVPYTTRRVIIPHPPCVCSMACGSPTVSRVVLAAGALREDRRALYPYMANHGASPYLLGGPPTNFLWRAFWVAPMGAPGRGYVGVPAFHIATNR